MKNCRTDGRNPSGYSKQWETFQQELKNNDIHAGHQNPTVAVLHFWVREMDGSISHYISSEDKASEFMYKNFHVTQLLNRHILCLTTESGPMAHTIRSEV